MGFEKTNWTSEKRLVRKDHPSDTDTNANGTVRMQKLSVKSRHKVKKGNGRAAKRDPSGGGVPTIGEERHYVKAEATTE
jgi:hypothetical protein